MVIKVKKLHPSAKIPEYATTGAAGMDLYSVGYAFGRGPIRVGTGLSIEIPWGWEGQIRSRSGLARTGVMAFHGTIDSDYRGEIEVLLYATVGYCDIEIEPGDRIAQLVISPVSRVTPVEVDELGETERGRRGWGSTGK